MAAPTLSLDRVDAVVFDMDGVITDTASVHAAAWKRLFDEYLEERARRTGGGFEPFDLDVDYRRYIDGKPRYDGVQDFLASRDIVLLEGDPSDPPDRETVCGLGNRKNDYFLDHLRTHGAEPYPSTVALVRRLHEDGVGVAVVSASQNAREVLDAAGVGELFEVRVDGSVADELGLPGKPEPDVFVEAARRLGAQPARTAIVEDAIAGVEAGRRGAFAWVIGVDRGGQADALRRAGADVVVSDLGELAVAAAHRDIRDLPLALERRGEVAELLASRRPAVFLDYDGTLTPIVNRPQDALLPPETREVIEALARRCSVAVLSGRDLADVRGLVGIDGIVYAGSHGFDILTADGTSQQRGREFRPELDAAERELRPRIEPIEGALLERKAFAVTAHFRLVAPEHVSEIEAAVAEVAARHPSLRRTGGKKVFELRPAVEWDKGRALLWLLEVLGLDGPDVLPIYVGDDDTDEDAFRVVRGRGLGAVVRGEGDDRTTDAQYALRDPGETRSFLELIETLAERRGP